MIGWQSNGKENRVFDEATQDRARQIMTDDWPSEAQVRQLGQQIFADGFVDATEVDLLFCLDEQSVTESPAWQEFFVNALTDFYVWKQSPPGVLTAASGAHLIERITADGRIRSMTEFALLRNIIKYAKAGPEEVSLLAMRGVRETALEGGDRLFGPKRRRPGVIDEEEVEIVRDIIYGMGGCDGYTVSQAEAELLFDLNDATAAVSNAAGWLNLFVKGVGNYLMFPRRQRTFDEERYRDLQNWLDERPPSGGFLRRMAQAVMNGDALAAAFKGASEETGYAVGTEEHEALQRLSDDTQLGERLTQIDQDEAVWLVNRINADGRLHENEETLLRHIRANATAIHPALEPLLARAGV